jgi:hypothetical protein
MRFCRNRNRLSWGRVDFDVSARRIASREIRNGEMDVGCRATVDPSEPSPRFVAGLHLLLYYAFWGAEFAKGANLIDMLTPIAHTTNLSPLPRVAWHATQAAYHWMVGDNEACLREAERGLEVSAETGVHLWDFMLRAQGVWGWLTAEDLDRAAAERETLHAQLDPLRYMDATHYHRCEPRKARSAGGE